jgi:hypothetical protein
LVLGEPQLKKAVDLIGGFFTKDPFSEMALEELDLSVETLLSSCEILTNQENLVTGFCDWLRSTCFLYISLRPPTSVAEITYSTFWNFLYRFRPFSCAKSVRTEKMKMARTFVARTSPTSVRRSHNDADLDLILDLGKICLKLVPSTQSYRAFFIDTNKSTGEIYIEETIAPAYM